MIKILFVAPYTESIPSIQNMISGISYPPDVSFSVIHVKGQIVKSSEDWDADIVIARGLGYQLLKEKQRHFQVISIGVTGYDLMRVVLKCVERYHPKRIGLFLAENIYSDIPFISKIFHVDIVRVSITSDREVEEMYEKLRMENACDAIIGGMTVLRFAKRDKFPFVRLETGEEAVKLAIGEALIAVEAMKHEKRRNELVNTMVESIEGGIIAVDSEWGVYAMNEICAKMFHIQRNNVMGMKAADFLPSAVLDNTLADNEELIVKQGKRQILVNRKPFMVDGSREGTIITFQYVDRIQNTEISVRKKLNSKGLIAKYNFSDIVGTSGALLKTIQYAKKYALTESDILITGESGTGKELFAQSIHNYSNRFQQPFVAFNCAAISENLIESELFGYVDGAFTGAAKGGKTGLFELAHRGTLFMDEIGELPLPLQAKILRVLQEKEVRRIGDDRMIPVDVRIIAATNVNLQDRARTGDFREDLYYRLDILNLQIPPLRERKQDIGMLAENFIMKSDESGKTVLGGRALEKLEAYSWPGNIRQLRNICERLCVLSGGREIDGLDAKRVMSHLYEASGSGNHETYDEEDRGPQQAEITGIHGEMLTAEEQAIALMVQKKKTKEELAKALGMSRSTLWRKLKESQKQGGPK